MTRSGNTLRGLEPPKLSCWAKTPPFHRTVQSAYLPGTTDGFFRGTKALEKSSRKHESDARSMGNGETNEPMDRDAFGRRR